MQEPVQLLAAVSRINLCTFCSYVSKTISQFTPPHILKTSEKHMPLPSSLVLSRNTNYPV